MSQSDEIARLERDNDRLAAQVMDQRAEIERLRTAYEAPPIALTAEELERMEGEPVYVRSGDGEEGWAIVQGGQPDMYSGDPDFINMTYNDPAGHFGLHVLGWQAFGRKPDDARADNTRLLAEVRRLRASAQNSEPVRHGRWTSVEYRPHVTGHHCSVCRYVTFSPGNYCLNCGAKMDAEKEEPTC